MSDTPLKRTKGSIIKLIYNITYTVHQIFEKNDLEYWASGGTFLGLIRHKGVIPWDDDCDLCVYDEKKFLSLVPQLEKCGLIITEVYFGYKIMYKDRPFTEASGYTYSFPNIDIFIMKLVKNNSRPYYKLKYTTEWKQEKYYLDEHYPLVSYPFGKGVMYGTRSYKEYLDRMYGKTWNKIAYREADHEKEEQLEKILVKLTDKDRVPARPIPAYTKRRCVSGSRKVTRRARRSRRRSFGLFNRKPNYNDKKCSTINGKLILEIFDGKNWKIPRNMLYNNIETECDKLQTKKHNWF